MSDETVIKLGGTNEMALMFRFLFNVRHGEELKLSTKDANTMAVLLRAREYTRCPDARKVINRIWKQIKEKQ